MTKLLDFRTSQNASFEESISIPLAAATPVLIGVVGLNIVDPGTFLRVDLSAIATINVTDESGAGLTITIVRGTLLTDPVVYSGILSVGTPDGGSPTVVALVAEGSDYNVPPPPSGLLVYSVFISSSNPVERIGPESFKATAYSD